MEVFNHLTSRNGTEEKINDKVTHHKIFYDATKLKLLDLDRMLYTSVEDVKKERKCYSYDDFVWQPIWKPYAEKKVRTEDAFDTW